jgi:hypothetical protein
MWEFSEKYVWGARGTGTAVGPLGTIRWVSINRLTRNPAWKERQRFLLALQELYPTVCDEIEDAFTAQLQTIPPAEWGGE